MKRTAVFGLILILVLGLLAGCTKKEQSSGDLLSQIKSRGEIVFATEGTYAPWSFHDESDTLVGYDIEVATRIAEKLGVKARFVECLWDGIFAGLDSERYDMVANEVGVTEERQARYDFTNPYAFIHTAVITSGDRDDIQSFEDLNGKTTANTLTSTYAALAESYGANTIGVDALDQTLELVLAGRVDATLNADVSFYDYMKAHPDANLKIVAMTEECVIAAFPTRKGEASASLIDAVNQALKELDEEGVLSELSMKYFGSDISRNQ